MSGPCHETVISISSVINQLIGIAPRISQEIVIINDFILFSFRYILYDINPGEGFNLRRDVFVRIAVMVKKMNENSSKFSYTLVLPPWGPLYHWQTRSLGDQTKIPWKNFFDVESISRYVPCLDFEDYLKSKFPLY